MENVLKKEKLISEVKIIETGTNKLIHTLSDPQRIDGEVLFHRRLMSEKLLRTIMNISFANGFGCSAPIVDNPDSDFVKFLIGTNLYSKNIKQYAKALDECIEEIYHFICYVDEQFDMSILDLSMFNNLKGKYEAIPIEYLSTLRDQVFNGSWRQLKNKIRKEEENDKIEIINCCEKFEKINKKDLGFIGYKIEEIVEVLINSEDSTNKN